MFGASAFGSSSGFAAGGVRGEAGAFRDAVKSPSAGLTTVAIAFSVRPFIVKTSFRGAAACAIVEPCHHVRVPCDRSPLSQTGAYLQPRQLRTRPFAAVPGYRAFAC